MPFAKGQSGNIEGRPIGSTDQTRRIRLLLNPHMVQLVEQTIAAAKQGDQGSANALIQFYATTAPATK